MKHLLAAMLVTAALASACSSLAGHPQPGDMGVFFTPHPSSGAAAVLNGIVAFEYFDVYVVSFDVPQGMEAYEFELLPPSGVLVAGGRLLPAGATDFGAGADNWIVGTGGVCQGQVGPFTLVTYASCLFLTPPLDDSTFCLGGATPSSFPAEYPRQADSPGYLACNSPGELHRFGEAYAGCATINQVNIPQPVAAATESFGTLKAAYGGVAGQ